MRNTKRISASNFFYGVAAILLVVQLALILWILKYQFVSDFALLDADYEGWRYQIRITGFAASRSAHR